MAKIAIVYRENDLFNVYVPKIISFLKEKGYEVEEMRFSRETSEEEIEKAIPRNFKKDFDKVLADGTCYPADGGFGILEAIISNAVSDSVLDAFGGNGHLETEVSKSLELTRNVFQKAIQSVSHMIGIPEKVFVSEKKLTDHAPFRTWENGKPVPMNSDTAVQYVISWVQDIFPDCLVQVGNPRLGDETYWAILDRHERCEPVYDGCVLVANLPAETFISDLGRLNLLPSEEEDVFPRIVHKLGRMSCFCFE